MTAIPAPGLRELSLLGEPRTLRVPAGYAGRW